MKKIYSLLILALLGIGSAWAYDFSAVAPTGQTLYYNINGSNAEVTCQNSSSPSYSNLSGALEIPSSVTYNGQTYSVTSIGSSAFQGCSGLTSVTIPNSVTSIGSYAFSGCSGLTSVTIGNSVTSIGRFAFDDCSGLTSVNYTGTIADWCNISFGNESANPLYYAHHLYINNSEVTSLVIPNTVDSINNYAFLGCSGLTSVTIGNSVTSIGYEAFAYCSGLQEITSLSQVAPALGGNVFYNVSSTIPVNIPCGSLNSYSSRWSYFSNFVEFVPDGIADAEQAAYTIRTTADRIVVEGINKETVRLFDCMGRCLQTFNAAEGCTIEAPAAGVYLLQVGNTPAQKVVVVK